MHWSKHSFFAVPLLLSLGACGHLSFQDGSGNETGLKYYTPKPYLLVSRTGAKDKPIEVQMIYLPDLKNPSYVKPIAGLGSSNLSLNLANGMVTSFGQITDPKLTELLGSVGGLATSLATAQKTRAETKALEQSLDISDGQILIANSKEIKSALGSPLVKSLTPVEQQILQKAADDSDRLGKALIAPGAKPDPAAVVTQLEGIVKPWEQVRKTSPGADPVKEYFDKLQALLASTNKILDKAREATPKPAAPPVLTLYEINFNETTKKTELTEVPMPTPQ